MKKRTFICLPLTQVECRSPLKALQASQILRPNPTPNPLNRHRHAISYEGYSWNDIREFAAAIGEG